MKLTSEEEDNGNIVEIERYDRLEYRYLTTGDFSALQQMNTEYPMETRTLIGVSPKTQLQAYPLKHTISQAYIKRKEYLSLL